MELSPALIANSVFLLVYVLLIWERIPKVVVALLGGTLMILTGVLTQKEAFSYIDFNVIFLLVGMMIIVNILKQTGVFDWMAYQVARKVGMTSHRVKIMPAGVYLFWALCLITAVCSALLDNVTTVLFMATITCALAEKLKINPVPFLIGEVIASNIGGTATLIGDPPNIMIASALGLKFSDFLVHVMPVILVILPVALVLLSFMYRKELVLSEETRATMAGLSLEGLIKDKPLMQKGLIVLGLVLVALILHHQIHQEVGTIALFGAAILMLFEDPKEVWADVEWDTIFFFIGLFILVGAVEKSGTLEQLAHLLSAWSGGNFTNAVLALLWVSGGLSGVIDNIPYTATMLPVIQSLAQEFYSPYRDSAITPLWIALSLGACLGGNATLIGATANVVVADIAAYKCGHRIGFWAFMKVGLLITIVSLAMAAFYLWFRYLL